LLRKQQKDLRGYFLTHPVQGADDSLVHTYIMYYNQLV